MTDSFPASVPLGDVEQAVRAADPRLNVFDEPGTEARAWRDLRRVAYGRTEDVAAARDYLDNILDGTAADAASVVKMIRLAREALA